MSVNITSMKHTLFYVLCFSAIYITFVTIQFGDSLIASNNLVEVSFSPKTINLKSKGKWIVCHLAVLSENYAVEDVNISSILLMSRVRVSYGEILGKKLKLTFNRTEVIDLLNEMFNPPPYIKFKYVDFRVTGFFFDRTSFSSSEKIKVIFD